MRARIARLLVLGVGPALAPFVLLAIFTWLRTGHPIGWVALFGRGEVLPATASLAGGMVANAYRVRRHGAMWHIDVGAAWFLVLVSCITYVVPYSGPVAADTRLATASVVILGLTVGVGIALIREGSP